MTDQKPPAPAAKPVAPQSTVSTPPVPASVPSVPATAKPAGAPPLPKPNFSVSNPTAPKPPGSPTAPSAAVAPKPPGTPPPASSAPKPLTTPAPAAATAAKPGTFTAPKPPQPLAQKPAVPGLPPKPPAGGLPPRAPSSMPAQPPSGASDVRPPGSSIKQAPPRPLGAPPAAGQLPPKPGLPQAKGVAAATGAVIPKAGTPLPPGKTPAGQVPPAPKSAEVKKSPLRFLPLILGLLLILGVVGFILSRVLAPKAPTTTTNSGSTQTPTQAQTVLTYWGLWEPSPVLQETFADFEAANPGIKINYQQQTYRDYRERLQAAIAGGKGPDLFRYHASWVPMLRAELSDMPSTTYTAAEYQTTFFPIANEQLQSNGRYVGIPLMYEGLALIYNKEIFNTANVQPPKTWAELRDLAVRLTIRDNGRIQRGGLAIGNSANVDNFSDIIGLLMLQNGATPADPTSAKAQEAIQFYTDFYTKSRVWDATLPNSTVAFARGDVAMILAPSWRIHEILSQNPNITIGVSPVPQLSDTKVTWASYWAEGVSAQSKNKDAAWKLLKYLSSPEALQKMHSDQSEERSFGEIYPRVDMANMLADSPYAAAYLADAPYAKDWYLNSYTHDNGLNDQIIKYFEDGITSIANGTGSAASVLPTVGQGLLQILRQYNLTR